MLTFITGGARSGKSALALRLAAGRGAPVVFVATATAGDDEMRDRIARHRAERPEDWTTVEEPVDLGGALTAAPAGSTVVVDCLSLWLFNVLHRDEEQIVADAVTHAALAHARSGDTIVVTNEVGSGIVPADPMTRRYRDLLGRVSAAWSLAADRAVLTVAGRVIELTHPDDLA